MGCHQLSISPPAASGQRFVVGRTDDDGKCVSIEFAHFGENILTILMRACVLPLLNVVVQNPAQTLIGLVIIGAHVAFPF